MKMIADRSSYLRKIPTCNQNITSRDYICSHSSIEQEQIRPKDKVEGLSPSGGTKQY